MSFHLSSVRRGARFNRAAGSFGEDPIYRTVARWLSSASCRTRALRNGPDAEAGGGIVEAMSDPGPVTEQLDAYNARDLDRFVACYTDDVIVEDAAGNVLMRGADGLREG